MLEFQKVSEDARGEIYILKQGGKEIAILISFNAGAPRGGHFHPNPQKMVCIYGELEYRLADPKDTDSEIRDVLGEGEVLDIKSGMAHLFIAKTPCLALETMEGGYGVTTYPPYREIVEGFLAKPKE